MIENNFIQDRTIAAQTSTTAEEDAKRWGIDPTVIKPQPQETPVAKNVQDIMSAPLEGAAKGAAATAESAVNLIPAAGDAIVSGMKQFDSWLQEKGLTHEALISTDFKFPKLDVVGPPSKDQQYGYAIGQFLAQTSAFAAGSVGMGVGKSIALSGPIAAAVMDPKAPRLADYIKDTPLVGPIAAFLVSKPDDSEAMSRLKNGLEAMTGNALLAGAFATVAGGLKNLRGTATEVVLPGSGPESAALKDVTPTPVEPLPGSPKSVDVVISPDYKSPLAGQSPDALLTKIRDMKAVGPEQIISNVDPAEKSGSASVDAQLAAQQGEQATMNQAARSRTGTTVDETLTAGSAIHADATRMQELLNRPTGASYNAEEITALGFETEAASKRLMQIAGDIVQNNASGLEVTEQVLTQYRQMADYFPFVREVFEGAMSESGRALNIKNYVFGTDMNKQAMSEYLALNGGSAEIKDQAAMLTEIFSNKGPQALQDVASKTVKGSTWGQALGEIYIQNLLSPMSAMKAVLSNISQQSLGILERQLAPAYAAARGEDTLALQMKFAANEATKSMARSAVAEISSGLEVFAESMKRFGQEVASGSPVQALDKLSRQASKGNRFAYQQGYAASSESLGVNNRLGAALIDTAASTLRLMSSPIAVVDRWSDALSFKMQGTYLATMKGMEKGLSGEELNSYVSGILAKEPTLPSLPSEVTPESMQKYLSDKAQYNEHKDIWDGIGKYRDAVKLQQTPESGWGADLYKAVNNDEVNDVLSVNGLPIVKAVSPFIRVAVNQAQLALDSTPFVQGLSVRNKEILAAGGVEADLLAARLKVMGTLMGLGAAGGLTHFMTGQGSLNPDTRASEKARGVVPYSFGSHAAFRELGAAGIVMSIGADLGVVGQYVGTGILSKEQEISIKDATEYITGSILDKITIDDVVVDFWSGAKDQNMKNLTKDTGNKLAGGAGALFVPATVNFARLQTDPFYRQSNNIIMDIVNRIPGLSDKLPAALDVMGYPIEHNKGFVRNVTDFNDNVVEKNQVLKGLINLGMAGALVNPDPEKGDPMTIRPMQKSLKFNGVTESIPLTPAQYNDMVLMSLGKESPDSSGNFQEQIKGILSNNKPDEIKKIQIKNAFAASRRLSKGMMLQKYPDLMEKYRELLSTRADALRGDSTDFMEDE